MNRRILTLQALTSHSLRGSPTLPNVLQDLGEVIRVNALQPLRRRCLLQVLLSTRSIDTSLATYAASRRIPLGGRSLGAYLRSFNTHTVAGVGRLSHLERQQFQNRIVNRRNHFMHEAGAYPAGVHEVDRLLAEMHACLARVFTL